MAVGDLLPSCCGIGLRSSSFLSNRLLIPPTICVSGIIGYHNIVPKRFGLQIDILLSEQ